MEPNMIDVYAIWSLSMKIEIGDWRSIQMTVMSVETWFALSLSAQMTENWKLLFFMIFKSTEESSLRDSTANTSKWKSRIKQKLPRERGIPRLPRVWSTCLEHVYNFSKKNHENPGTRPEMKMKKMKSNGKRKNAWKCCLQIYTGSTRNGKFKYWPTEGQEVDFGQSMIRENIDILLLTVEWRHSSAH